MRIEALANHRSWIPDLAGGQFEHWGRLTGFDTLEKYTAALEGWSAGRDVPTVLVRRIAASFWGRGGPDRLIKSNCLSTPTEVDDELNREDFDSRGWI